MSNDNSYYYPQGKDYLSGISQENRIDLVTAFVEYARAITGFRDFSDQITPVATGQTLQLGFLNIDPSSLNENQIIRVAADLVNNDAKRIKDGEGLHYAIGSQAMLKPPIITLEVQERISNADRDIAETLYRTYKIATAKLERLGNKPG